MNIFRPLMDIYCSGSHFAALLLGLFQADNKGEPGVMGFPGPRVSTDTFRHFFLIFLYYHFS